MTVLRVLFSVAAVIAFSTSARAQKVERVVIDADFPGAYQVEIADVNGDGRPDVIAVGGSTCAWYENPSWTKRVVSGPKETPGIISSATADLNGDGKSEIAIAYEFGMNTPRNGKLAMALQPAKLDGAWRLEPVAAIPSIHRLRFGDLDGDGALDLVVAPIFGPEAKPPAYVDPARLVVLRSLKPGARPEPEPVGAWPIMHSIEVKPIFGGRRSWIVAATDQGTPLIGWGKGQAGATHEQWLTGRFLTGAVGATPAKRGASEVHVGTMADGRRLLATIEPWHGTVVAAYQARLEPKTKRENDLDPFRDRQVLDDTLDDGHALWVADLDGDGDDEILAGHRGKDHRVSLYDYNRAANSWTKTVIDREIAAQDLRGGDLDGDGTPDVVAVGGSTKNVVWYRFKK